MWMHFIIFLCYFNICTLTLKNHLLLSYVPMVLLILKILFLNSSRHFILPLSLYIYFYFYIFFSIMNIARLFIHTCTYYYMYVCYFENMYWVYPSSNMFNLVYCINQVNFTIRQNHIYLNRWIHLYEFSW